MLHFPEEYFKTEVRDGFAISELMKRAWAAQLEVLNKIIAICDKYNLKYYAYWGTLLGLVRHQGFIPWDDDLDIAMKKEDYLTLLEVAKKELPPEYCILNYYTETEWDNVFTRITNGHAIDFSENKMTQYHNCPFVVGVDIFPLYYLPNNAQEAEIQKSVLNLINDAVNLVNAVDLKGGLVNNEAVAQILVELEQITGYQFTTDRPIKNQLYILYDQMSQLFDESEGDELTVFPIHMQNGYSVNKELLGDGIPMPFENITMNAPMGYDAILTKTFGDYMVPRRVKAAHDYPFYEGQLQIWMNHVEAQGGRNMVELPDSWMERVYPEGKDARKKKVMLFHADAATLLANGGCALEKLRYVLNIFRGNPDVLLWWYAGILESPKLTNLKKMTSDLYEGYLRIVEEYKQENFGIYDESGDMQRAVTIADGYFGDNCELMELFKTTDKPIMLQDYEITK